MKTVGPTAGRHSENDTNVSRRIDWNKESPIYYFIAVRKKKFSPEKYKKIENFHIQKTK